MPEHSRRCAVTTRKLRPLEGGNNRECAAPAFLDTKTPFRSNELSQVEFVFSCYDVGGRSSLSMNELFLLLKSTSAGLCKLSGIDAPDSARLESIASLVRQNRGLIPRSAHCF